MGQISVPELICKLDQELPRSMLYLWYTTPDWFLALCTALGLSLCHRRCRADACCMWRAAHRNRPAVCVGCSMGPARGTCSMKHPADWPCALALGLAEYHMEHAPHTSPLCYIQHTWLVQCHLPLSASTGPRACGPWVWHRVHCLQCVGSTSMGHAARSMEAGLSAAHSKGGPGTVCICHPRLTLVLPAACAVWGPTHVPHAVCRAGAMTHGPNQTAPWAGFSPQAICSTPLVYTNMIFGAWSYTQTMRLSANNTCAIYPVMPWWCHVPWDTKGIAILSSYHAQDHHQESSPIHLFLICLCPSLTVRQCSWLKGDWSFSILHSHSQALCLRCKLRNPLSHLHFLIAGVGCHLASEYRWGLILSSSPGLSKEVVQMCPRWKRRGLLKWNGPDIKYF